MLHGVRMVSVGLEKVKHRLSEDLERDAHMAVIVERVEHFHAQVAAIRVAGVEFPGRNENTFFEFPPTVRSIQMSLLQDVNLQLGGLSVLVDVFNDLQSGDFVVGSIPNPSHFAEGSLA